MSTIVGVMDRPGLEANTDNLVLVDPAESRLTWVPRDLWCETFRARINRAFSRGGHDLLVEALDEHGFRVANSLVLSREATEDALADVVVLVPVPCRMTFSYPLTPQAPIEDGSKVVVFDPPAEVLRGERIHQWVGARDTDLHRIERQKIFVRRLLEKGFDFRRVLARPAWYAIRGADCLAELAQVRPQWRFETVADLVPVTIAGQVVLVRRKASPAGRATGPEADRAWLDKPHWTPVDAPVRSAPSTRSRARLLEVVAQFEVETTPRYQPVSISSGSTTWCNIFVWDATRALGAEIPHCVDEAGRAVPVGQGTELTANRTLRWLETHGLAAGWREEDAAGAIRAARAGSPAVAIWHNPFGPGHVALVVPCDDDGVHIAQAGAACFSSRPLAHGFGERSARFFVHA
ncbi:MAG TPA: hypothetical protein VMS64_31625 [Candidatus Methylomirabilis sp.]|nr:hypothetical protein [Candidatus Methylomirabilis sp.]